MIVIYRFQVGSKTYTHRCNVRGSDYQKGQIGGPVTVTYLPDRPEVSRAEPSNDASSAYWSLWVEGIGFGLAVILCAVEIVRRRAS